MPVGDYLRGLYFDSICFEPAIFILTIGVALVHSGQAIGDPIAAVASLLVLADT
jgi:hypothetical protein